MWALKDGSIEDVVVDVVAVDIIVVYFATVEGIVFFVGAFVGDPQNIARFEENNDNLLSLFNNNHKNDFNTTFTQKIKPWCRYCVFNL